ncbi:DUF397 domain-containing protein [Streptomyces griseoviridis]|uniref:DUF397 domain-containing protein n=1 Tax=Streptomyces griseoviridis TaxID=45398 RepID=A0A3Q9KX08_STRGD|nr:DUF397 domain-containing protein [Streptomyces griseoviridis]AZS86084.1 DUF397 domain-containing protein [Streptomyces griseoviridis]QCN87056.1 DUF397 domain-containing protein [Streptomyces griseoviridis]
MICEASTRDASGLVWFKSSYSSSSEGDSCVEVAASSSTVHIRDSKVIGGPQLAVAPGAWAGLVAYALSGAV